MAPVSCARPRLAASMMPGPPPVQVMYRRSASGLYHCCIAPPGVGTGVPGRQWRALRTSRLASAMRAASPLASSVKRCWLVSWV